MRLALVFILLISIVHRNKGRLQEYQRRYLKIKRVGRWKFSKEDRARLEELNRNILLGIPPLFVY
jgi:hypothetical protein